ncbi:MAG: hypothetical protein M1305_02610 [Candidatus Marsarchaeota archaeon]|nr:hypothetical protein [Candidatus Marsarchaeota archaeon]
METQLLQTSYAQRVVDIGRRRRYWFRVVGDEGMISRPVFRDNFWVSPLSPDCTLPSACEERIRSLMSEGVAIQGVLIAHEASHLLPGKIAPKPKREPIRIPWAAIGGVATLGVGIVGIAAAVFVKVIAFMLTVTVGVLLDPAVIVVLEDGTWVEVYSWVD